MFCLFFMLNLHSQEPALEWANDFIIAGVDSSLTIENHTTDLNENNYIIGNFSGTIDFDSSSSEAIFSTASSSENDFFIAKYNSDGEYLWCITLKDMVYSLKSNIETDNDGNIYIARSFLNTVDFDPSANTFELNPLAQSDVFIAKYNVDGEFVWANSLPCTGNTFVDDLELDKVNERFYITGDFYETIDFDPSIDTDEYTAQSSDNFDTYIAKYDFDGNYEWAHQIAKGGIGGNDFSKLAVDEETEDVYLKGHFVDTVQFDIDSIAPQTIAYGSSSDGNRDVFIVKYTAAGAFSWVVRLYGEENQDIRGLRFNDGFLYCAGGAIEEVNFSNSSTNQNIASNIYGSNPIIVKIDSGGNFVKAIEVESIDGGWGGANDLDLTSDSSIIVMGILYNAMDFSTDSGVYEVFGDSSDYRIYLASYDTDLNLKYVNVLYGTGPSDYIVGVSSVKGSNSFSITGGFRASIDLDPSQSEEYLLENNDINRKWFLAKYKESSLSLEQEQFNNQKILLYPNPSDEVHTLQLNGFEQDNMHIAMYDIQGRKLKVIHNGKVSNEQIFQVDVSSLNAGVYLYRIISNHQRKTIRFVKQ